MATTSKSPTTFADGVSAAMQDLAGAMSAPDADLHFGTEMIKVMGTWQAAQHKSKTPQTTPPGGAGGAAGAPGGGSPGGPPGGAQPGGPAGGGAANPQMQAQQAPTGPAEPGSGPTPGLSPNPDEMRRVMQEVAGQ